MAQNVLNKSRNVCEKSKKNDNNQKSAKSRKLRRLAKHVLAMSVRFDDQFTECHK
jgi:hypothetical protein